MAASMAITTTGVGFLPQQYSLKFSLRRTSLCAFSPKTLLGGGGGGGGGGSFSPSISIQVSASPKSNIYTMVVVSEKKERSSVVQTSAVRHLVGSLTKSEGLRFAVVVARFNEVVTRLLLDGALETFKRFSVREEDVDVVWVPGSFEIPVVAERLGKLGKYQAIICIGAVVRGDTTHYDAVANSAASGVLSAGLSSGVPCIFGVLTCDSMDQALNRAGGKVGNKGSEAALTAIEMASLFEHHLKK